MPLGEGGSSYVARRYERIEANIIKGVGGSFICINAEVLEKAFSPRMKLGRVLHD